ncbi:Fluconazole resistance protein 1 [Ascochyta rabiei]|uniref:Fluconazole resistance protein 1 n=1 Tax=Didymella rabiei TaxID=5454 RepID=UPI00220F0E36|nr:Fluconazole resistance protein 1 [Ascochyta rabiei]UPX14620.1 Fluconazole resistance protein 1 [Ascochyta rabiei]
MPPAIMDRTRKRAKQACDQCRVKKTKVSNLVLMRLSLMLTLISCDGEHLCGRCRAENSVCNYSQRASHQQSRNSHTALLETQNRQLKNALQMLYEYVQTGHSLPALPVQSMGDGRPFLHDIVTYLNAVPIGASIRHDQLPYQISRPNTMPTASLPQSQPEPLPYSTFVATVSEPNTFMVSLIQQDMPLLEHEILESRLNLQEIYSLMDTDGAEAAGLHWLQTHTA